MTDTPTLCIWFNSRAAEAAAFYCSVFPHSEIISQNPLVTQFRINGMKIMALNRKPDIPFNDSFSIVINCDNQSQIDQYWDAITTNGGQESMCGWCKDKFGVSWQIIPSNLGKILSNPNISPLVMEKFMKMKKIIMEDLE